MAPRTSFVRFHVLLTNEWATQCTTCWKVIAFSPDQRALALAEDSHQCRAGAPHAEAAVAHAGTH